MDIATRGDYALRTDVFEEDTSYCIVNIVTGVVEFRGVVLPEAYEVLKNLDKGLTKAQEDMEVPKIFQH